MQNIQAEDQSFVQDIVKRSASSFYWGMNILEYRKRRAMFAVYAFCRIVDDIADSDFAPNKKKKLLSQWKKKINSIYKGIANENITRELLLSINSFKLKKKDFLNIIEGMIKDTEKKIIYPNLKELEDYCDKVAGAVGCISVNIFEISDEKVARDYAINLGRALQCTNILRDLWEDNNRGRCYINKEIIKSEGLQNLEPCDVLKNEKFEIIFEKFLEQTLIYYSKVEKIKQKIDKKKILSAEIMKSIYCELLKKMTMHNFKNKKKIKIHPIKKLLLVLKEILR